MISIYLITKKKSFNVFSTNYLVQLYLCLIFEKVIYTYFYLLLLENNEFLQFYLQKYLDLFSFKKSDLYKLF